MSQGHGNKSLTMNFTTLESLGRSLFGLDDMEKTSHAGTTLCSEQPPSQESTTTSIQDKIKLEKPSGRQ